METDPFQMANVDLAREILGSQRFPDGNFDAQPLAHALQYRDYQLRAAYNDWRHSLQTRAADICNASGAMDDRTLRQALLIVAAEPDVITLRSAYEQRLTEIAAGSPVAPDRVGPFPVRWTD